MRKIDYKSLLIGFLMCLCIFLATGQSSENSNILNVQPKGFLFDELLPAVVVGAVVSGAQEWGSNVVEEAMDKNKGHIGVRSLTIQNSKGKPVALIGADNEGDGFILIYDSNGKKKDYLGVGKDGSGLLGMSDKYGTMSYKRWNTN